IVYEARNSFIRPMTADANLNHGQNAFVILLDELHVVSREFWRTIRTALGKRRDPLLICTTTPGWDRQSVCHERYSYACRVRDGLVNDPSFLPVIYETSPEDDWTSEDTWKKANPNLGISVQRDYLAARVAEAQELPGEENTVRQLH